MVNSNSYMYPGVAILKLYGKRLLEIPHGYRISK